MHRASHRGAPVIALALIWAATTPAHAQRSVTRVHVADIRGDEGEAEELRRLLREETERVATVRIVARARARYVVRGAIVSCERRRVERQHEVRCEVAWVVSDRRSENMQAVVRSSGTVRGSSRAWVEAEALRAAARGIVVPLSDPRRLELRRRS